MRTKVQTGPRTATTKGDLKRLRLRGLVPITLQHRGEATLQLEAESHQFEEQLRKHGEAGILEITVHPGGRIEQALIHDVQRDPVTRRLLHITLQKVSRNEPVKAHIPIALVGEPESVRQGSGVLQQQLTTLEIRCMPSDLPEHIVLDVSQMDVNGVLRVADLPAGGPYEAMTSADAVVVTITPVRVAEPEPEAVAEEPSGEGTETTVEES